MIHFPLLGVGQHMQGIDLGRSLPCEDRKGFEGKHRTADRVGQGLGGHESDPQAGVAAGTDGDDDAVQIAHLPGAILQQAVGVRHQVAGMAPGFFQRQRCQHPVALGQGYPTLAVGRFQEQQSGIGIHQTIPNEELVVGFRPGIAPPRYRFFPPLSEGRHA